MALIIDPQGTAAPPAGGDVVIDSDTEHFAVDVIDGSIDRPVIVDFWAPWCGPCKQLTPMLEKLVRQAGGLVRLVKINVDENQALATQLRIQSIPTVYAFSGGRPVDAFTGAQTESSLRAFIGRLTAGATPPLAQALDMAQAALDGGDAKSAAAVFTQILGEDPRNAKAIAGLIRSRLALGDVAGARSVVSGLTPDLTEQVDIKAARTAVELAERGGATGDIGKLTARVNADASDHAARFDLAEALFAAGQAEAAINALLDIIRRDRTWNEDAARVQLLKFFDALGPTHPLTTASRRRLSSILFS
jgi:putative thioredoxin